MPSHKYTLLFVISFRHNEDTHSNAFLIFQHLKSEHVKQKKNSQQKCTN